MKKAFLKIIRAMNNDMSIRVVSHEASRHCLI